MTGLNTVMFDLNKNYTHAGKIINRYVNNLSSFTSLNVKSAWTLPYK